MKTHDSITIRRCPSFNKVSGLMAEWGRYEHNGAPMSPSRAVEIGGYLMAASMCKRQGLPMPKDWKRAHPSMPYQAGAWAEKITSSALVRGANDVPTIWIECGRTTHG